MYEFLKCTEDLDFEELKKTLDQNKIIKLYGEDDVNTGAKAENQEALNFNPFKALGPAMDGFQTHVNIASKTGAHGSHTIVSCPSVNYKQRISLYINSAIKFCLIIDLVSVEILIIVTPADKIKIDLY